MNRPYRYILCFAALLSFSACERLSLKNHNVFSSHAGEAQRGVEQEDMTPMPALRTSGERETVEAELTDSSVEIFDMKLNPDYRRGEAPSMAVSPMRTQSMRQQASVDSVIAYGEGVQAADSSVTIYGLDGAAIPYAGITSYGTGQVSNYGQGYGQVAGEIFFKHGSSRLGSGDIRKISNLAEQAKFAPVNYVTVEGFSSKPTQVGMNTVQAHIINLRQSMKRSEKVSKALVQKGVPGDKIKTVGWGASKATGNNSRDRRVDVIIGEK